MMISIRDILGIRSSTAPKPYPFLNIVGDEPWPPRQWKEANLNDSVQCRKYGLLNPYYELEASLGKYEYRRSLMTRDEYMECVNFFRLLRESKGYDIQSFPSCIKDWVSHALAPMPLDLVSGPCRGLIRDETATALKRINAEAACRGEAYEFGEYVNVVGSDFCPMTLLTFTVKRVGDGEVETAQAMIYRNRDYINLGVEEWRFKPK